MQTELHSAPKKPEKATKVDRGSIENKSHGPIENKGGRATTKEPAKPKPKK